MLLLVTLGTDGNTNWVRTPDGQKFNLGSVSVLTFVTKLALGGAWGARRALNDFLQGREVILRVDDDKMWKLLAPYRTVWAADSFIPYDYRKRGIKAMTINKDLRVLEEHVRNLHLAAETRVGSKKLAEGTSILSRLVSKIVDQSNDVRYYGLGEPIVGASTKLAYDTYEANGNVATSILDQMEAVNGRVDELVTAGKKFNSKQAKMDIHRVVSRVASIVDDADLTASWVAGDLQKLASRAEYLHRLFFCKQR